MDGPRHFSRLGDAGPWPALHMKGLPYLSLTQGSHTYEYYTDPDGISISVVFRDRAGAVLLGPWSQERAARHAKCLQVVFGFQER